MSDSAAAVLKFARHAANPGSMCGIAYDPPSNTKSDSLAQRHK